MKKISLTMVRPHLNDIPQFPFPPNYRLKTFEPNDAPLWADIEVSVDEFDDRQAALQRFDREFGSCPEEMSARCLFVVNERGEAVGTTTAWYGSPGGEEEPWGRIHWVAIKPEHQGKKLAKPLLSSALNVLARYHEKAYLTTQTTSYQAINLYLNYGFVPLVTKAECMEGWRLLEKTLNRNIVS